MRTEIIKVRRSDEGRVLRKTRRVLKINPMLMLTFRVTRIGIFTLLGESIPTNLPSLFSFSLFEAPYAACRYHTYHQQDAVGM